MRLTRCLLLLLANPALAIVLPPAVVNIACGGIAGAAGAIAVYPIDTLKTRLQSEEGIACYGSNGVEAAVALLQAEGPLSLYRGLGPQLTGVVPEKTLKLFVHDSAVLYLGEVFSGALAGLCQVVVTNPLEIVKVRLQLSTSGDAWAVLSRMGVWSNPLVLYQGAAAYAARDSTFSAILFPCYASSKALLASETPLTGAFLLLVAGFLAGAPAAFMTTPFDVVKTRLQQDKSLQPTIGEDGEECVVPETREALPPLASDDSTTTSDENAIALCQRIVSEEGATVLFRGGLERVLRSAPQFGITLAIYDSLKEVLLGL